MVQKQERQEMGRKIHSTAINTKRLKKGEEVVRRGKILHVLGPYSIKYIVKFRTKDGRYRTYEGEVPHMYDEESAERALNRIVEKSIIYALNWC